MAKGDPSGPKAIANRQKQKGLQRLRWYCQMCSKQCRDENGFKCHLGSESHARQMALFGDAPAQVVDEFSRQFEEAWLEHMRRAHPTTRVRADVVYNELIQQRDHVHMNATRWHTLTEFVSHLGRAGLCRVDEDERGLHVTLAAADARVAGAEEARARRARQAAEAEARRAAALAAQAERARAEEARVLGFDAAARAKGGELVRKEGDAPVRLSVSGFGGGGVGGGTGGGGGAGAAAAGNGGGAAASALLVPAIFSSETAVAATATAATAATAATSAAAEKSRERPKSKLELLMEQEQAAKRKRQEEEDEQEEKARANASSSSAAAAAAAAEKRHRANNEESTAPVPAAATAVPAADAPWLSRGLVVKIMAPELKASGHYKRKAVVVSIVVDGGGESNGAKKGPAAPVTGFVAELETLDDDRDVLRVDQAQLETVLPGVGGAVRVVSSSATDAVNSSSKKRKKGGEGGGGESGGGGGGNGSGSFSVSRFVGEEGRLSEVDAARYRARVTFDRSRSRRSEEKVKEEGGGESEWFEYEDICKVVAL